MINQLRERQPGLVILATHDPAAAARLARATGPAPALATAQPGRAGLPARPGPAY
jgi:hypothetical protein